MEIESHKTGLDSRYCTRPSLGTVDHIHPLHSDSAHAIPLPKDSAPSFGKRALSSPSGAETFPVPSLTLWTTPRSTLEHLTPRERKGKEPHSRRDHRSISAMKAVTRACVNRRQDASFPPYTRTALSGPPGFFTKIFCMLFLHLRFRRLSLIPLIQPFRSRYSRPLPRTTWHLCSTLTQPVCGCGCVYMVRPRR